MESYIGRTLGDFEIVRVLGKGGQGFVFVAHQKSLKRDVALKVIPVPVSTSSNQIRRFTREVEATAKLKHPNIVEIYQTGQEVGHCFYAMELIEGWSFDKIIAGMKSYALTGQEEIKEAEPSDEPETLDEDDFHLKEPDIILKARSSASEEDGAQSGNVEDQQEDVAQAASLREDVRLEAHHYDRLPADYYRWAAKITQQAANALEHAHKSGIIHRDIKPSNLMVSKEDVVKITDFGLARDIGEQTITITGSLLGSPPYMSPEQIRARRTPIDERTDIYSLGVTLYEAISLDRPFKGQTTQEIYHQISVKEPKDPRRINPNAPRDLAVIALKAVEKDPDRRYQSARDMAEDLNRYLSNIPIVAKPPTLVDKTVKFVKRNKVQVSIASLAAGLLIIILGVIWAVQTSGKSTKVNEFLGQAQQAEAEERYDDALRFYDKVLALDESHSEALRQSAMLSRKLADEEANRSTEMKAQRDRARKAGEEAKAKSEQLAQQKRESEILLDDAYWEAYRKFAEQADSIAQLLIAVKGRDHALQHNMPSHNWEGALWQAVADCPRMAGSTQPGHSDSVRSVSFSPDGETLASGSWDGTIKLWDVVTGREKATLKGHSSKVWSVSFSPDGTILASGGRSIKLWDVTTGQEKATLEGHSEYVTSVSFSPDGKMLASSGGMIIKLWDIAACRKTSTLRGHSGQVQSVNFSPDGKTLASGSFDRTIKLWDIATDREKAVLKGHLAGVQGVNFSPDGATLASGSADATIKLWDAATFREKVTFRGHLSRVESVSFSPDGKTLASGSFDRTIKLWDIVIGREKATLRGHSGWVCSVSFSPDGETLASGNHDATIKFWDLATGSKWPTLKGHSTGIASVSFGPDGKTLASVSGDATIKLWDVATGREKATLKRYSRLATSLSFSPDGTTIASGGLTIKLWDVAAGSEKATLRGHSGCVLSVSFSPDGKTLASPKFMPPKIKFSDIKELQL